METRNKKKAAAKKAPSKPTTRRKAQQTAGSRIDQLVELQERAIDRYAALASSATSRIVAGDFNLSRWAKDYATIWSDTAEDLSKTTRAMLATPSARPGKSKGPKKAGRSEDALRNWLLLQQSFLSRVANYYAGFGKLVAAGSVEPREWIEDGANFWRDVLADVSDWTHQLSGEELRATAAWLPRLRKAVRAGKLADHLEFTVPIEAFSDDPAPDATITLFTDGLIRVGGGVTLKPPQNVELVPSSVPRSSPSSQLMLYDLPGSLVPGDVYAGIVWAKETKFPIVSIEVQIV